MPEPSQRLRIVIDTSVLVAALTQPRGAAARLLTAWREGRFDVVTSQATLREAEAVAGAAWLRRIDRRGVESLLSDLRVRSLRVRDRRVEGLPLSDAGDRRLVEAAVEGNAAYVVTADREVLRYRGHGSAEFVTPAEFLRVTSS